LFGALQFEVGAGPHIERALVEEADGGGLPIAGGTDDAHAVPLVEWLLVGGAFEGGAPFALHIHPFGRCAENKAIALAHGCARLVVPDQGDHRGGERTEDQKSDQQHDPCTSDGGMLAGLS
jgi:hypothetical protein